MGAPLNDHQVRTITRAAVLLGGFGSVLSDHEHDLVEEAGRRFQRTGRATWITDNEWRVLEEAVGAMSAARDDKVRA